MNTPVNTIEHGPSTAARADGPGNVVDLADYRRAALYRRGQALDIVDPGAEAAIDDLLTSAMSDLLHYSQRANRIAALALIRFTESRLLEETYGRAFATRLAAQLHARLDGALRPGDRCLPLEHDTFVVLLHDLAGEGSAMEQTRRLCREAGGTVQLDFCQFTLTTKAGVAVIPVDGVEPDTLLRYARIAMRQANDCASNDVQRYEPLMLSAMREQVAMAGELRQAIDDGRLELYYQPQYSLSTGELISAEALMRLRDMTGALVMPDRFIRIAEETGLIVEMGRWAIDTACRQLADWRAGGLAMQHIAVNLSPRQLLDAELVPTIKAAVLGAGLAFSDLELELTEAQMIENLPLVNNVLDEITALGVRIAVDDFGTGYSSLAYLWRLPLHRLKVDRSLVQAATINARSARIVAAIVAIAEELGLQVTAEGIETEAQRRLVADAGCHLVQGFLMARPMPAQGLSH